MNEVIISYSQKDDIESPFGEVPDKIISLFKRQLQQVYKGLDADHLVFMDDSSIKDGDRITDSIEHAIENCSVMIAFCSPNYFRSHYCLEEWKLFKEVQAKEEKHGDAPKLLIPILFESIESVKRDLSDKWGKEGKTWVEELTSPQGLKYSEMTQLLFDRSKGYELIQHMKALAERILTQVKRHAGQREENNGSNILVLKEKIELTLRTKGIQDQILRFKGKFKGEPVCIIYTGGTVGMIRSENSDEYHIDYRMASSIDEIVYLLNPKLSALPFDMHFMGLKSTIDSSNIRSSDWVKLAKIITEQIDNYQGFVILHGANTMAYTASALSFLLESLPKPVILTGSEVPLGDSNSDAEHNVINAIRAAAPDAKNGPYPIPEVCLFYGNHLYRGNRVTKKYASDRSEGFHTPNMSSVLGTLQNERLIIEHNMLRSNNSDQELRSSDKNSIPDLKSKVVVFHVYPEMSIKAWRSYIKSAGDVKGIILRSYGPGNTPDDAEFVDFMEELIRKKGIVVVNTTQCQYGKVELKIFETSAKLFDIGVANGGDMTLEAAYCKLMYVLSQSSEAVHHENMTAIKNMFESDLRGELSVSTNTIYLHRDQFTWNEQKKVFMSNPKTFDKHFSRLSIVDAFIRLEEVRMDLEDFEFVIFSEKPKGTIEESKDHKNALVSFHKTLNEDEKRNGYFEKNLEITHSFRKNYKLDHPIFLTLATLPKKRFDFESVQLIVYTKV